MKTTLLLPTFNEIDALKVILPKIKKSWVDEIIVVDANSKDGTIDFCKKFGLRIYIQKTKGYGAGIKEAVDLSKGDIIIEFPPDGNSIPEKIPDVARKLKSGYDLVIASRYKDGARSYDDDILTKFGNRLFTKMTNLFFSASYTDCLVGFRGYRKSAFEKLKMDAKGLVWPLQSSIRFHKYGYKVTEIPADEPKRIGGGRKMKPFSTGLAACIMLLKEKFSGG